MLPFETNSWKYYYRKNSILRIILVILLSCFQLHAQSGFKKHFPVSAVSLQYAGSIGWMSTGYFIENAKKKIELGLLYGYTPDFAGGELHTATLKFIYKPIIFYPIPGVGIEPLNTGVFISQHFGRNLYISWPEKYSAGYYWWNPSTRTHFFISSQANFELQRKFVKRLAVYFEANTNDLYIGSYFGHNNNRSLGLDEIFFFGVGSKIYF